MASIEHPQAVAITLTPTLLAARFSRMSVAYVLRIGYLARYFEPPTVEPESTTSPANASPPSITRRRKPPRTRRIAKTGATVFRSCATRLGKEIWGLT
jgi:hypothetical protein